MGCGKALLAFCVVLWGWGLTPPAWGAALGPCPQEIHFRQVVEVANDTITLADLLAQPDSLPSSWRAIFRSIELGPTPPLGTQRFIRAENLRAYMVKFLRSRGVDPESTLLVLPDRLTIQRAAIYVEDRQIQQMVTAFIRTHAPWDPSEMEIRDITFSGLPMLPAGSLTHQIEARSGETFLGHVNLSIHFFLDGKKVRTLKAAAEVVLKKRVLHAARPLKRGEIISPDDVEMREIEISDPSRSYVFQVSQAVGKRLVHAVSMGEPLELTSLDKPLLVRRGKTVTIVYQTPGIMLTARGKAKEAGGHGDWIRIVNLDSDKVLKGQVLDENTVRVPR
ncbi:flagella basal body P-ring formation protein FlgA [Desulfacinum hydrothermale DSM 13146]|uniref:Flagella basal body P-ring formation protein FlgA n=1 Tax=Desulfacinum hydrothermale DSM 13146 TaxID=1121390 RepID=A0A1W1X6C7_9BACT|nr:flagellar basal body P-ring formation chaperone FlgA [Desulfacinum hydrothermale]SMC19377.1 flagella basal body P-ring formation protein FlgA [Desulfacinum hydrothermale DSM 13146]